MPWPFVGLAVIWLFSWIGIAKREARVEHQEKIEYLVKR